MPKLTPARTRRTAGGLAAARAAIGLGFLVAPRLTMRAAGLASNAGRSTSIAARLFGAREVVLGVMVLERLRFGTPEATLLRFNGMCDAMDAIVLAGAGGNAESRWRELLSASTASLAAASWFALAQSSPE